MTSEIKTLKQAASKLSDKDLDKFAIWVNELSEQRDYRKLCDDSAGVDYKTLLREFKKSTEGLWKKGKLELADAACATIAMEEFYKKIRAKGCSLDEDADILTVEWGPASKTEFSLTHVREVAPPRRPDRDSEIWQLRLEMRFPMSPELQRLQEGSKIFKSLRQVENDHYRFCATSPVGSATRKLEPRRILLTYENVE